MSLIFSDGYCSRALWSFVALAQRLLICLLQQALLWQALFGSGDGGAMAKARLLVTVYVIVARWSKGLFVISITFYSLYYYGWLSIDRWTFSQKKLHSIVEHNPINIYVLHIGRDIDITQNTQPEHFPFWICVYIQIIWLSPNLFHSNQDQTLKPLHKWKSRNYIHPRSRR